jgi:3-oxoacyl-[acyl-carrier protein] reductase
MAVNLTGPMRLTKAVAPADEGPGRGRMVNIASVAGLTPTGSSIAYAVSKAGLIHLTRCMAVGLAPGSAGELRRPGPARRHPRHRQPAPRAGGARRRHLVAA